MKPSISEAEFATLVKRAGLTLTDQQRAALYEGYGFLEEMIARVRTPREIGAEPAHVFGFSASPQKVR